ncbi:hypothetical protein U1Q18_001307 [Sarracenia purpurea var. burkii]
MEDSLGSSVIKAVSPKGTQDAPEESGWTSYFEDFLSKQRAEQTSLLSESFGSPSFVSDAASRVPCKTNNYNQIAGAVCFPKDGSPPMMPPKKLSFKKTRTKEISYDDSLEDTASSPVNSPKVSSLKHMDLINPRKREDDIESYMGKGGGIDCCSELQTRAGNEVTFEGNNNECTELSKRGLCLVPLSMLVNYLD